MNRWLVTGLIVLTVIMIYLSGPKIKVHPELSPLSLPPALEDLNRYLDEKESVFSDIKPDVKKRIRWHHSEPVKTKYSIIYIHGFSASLLETAPLIERISQKLGANSFETRLKGHGRSNSAMGEATLNAWLDDVNEAIEVGSRLGEKVILVGVSTGATLSSWFAVQQDSRISQLIWISPNFGPANLASEVVTWPWGKEIAKMTVGSERCFVPQNDFHAAYWTYCYPTEALIPMMSSVVMARNLNLQLIQKPLLLVYSAEDKVIHLGKLKKAFTETGSVRKELLVYDQEEDQDHHILAGNVFGIASTDKLVKVITDFILRNSDVEK